MWLMYGAFFWFLGTVLTEDPRAGFVLGVLAAIILGNIN